MKITFLGTAGYIDISSELHALQSSTLVAYDGTTVMLDCGEDWVSAVHDIAPDAIAITHAHPDHFWGLKRGAPCPVWATSDSWERAGRWRAAVEDRRTVIPRAPFSVGSVVLEAFTCRHAVRAPAVGYRITAGAVSIFYVPDVLLIDEAHEALAGADAYIGDGAVISRSLVRTTKDGVRVGHASIRVQLDWCKDAGVSRAVFTHCGSQITRADEQAVESQIRRLGHERGIVAEVAHDRDAVEL